MERKIKKILVLTNIYPALDMEKENTPVVHYFTREWVNMGYEVRVIHYPSNFPKIFMWIASFFKQRISSKLGTVVRTYQTNEYDYIYDNVKIKRIPLLKYKLHSRYSRKQVDKAYNKTVAYLNKQNFYPDIIVSHWVNPQIEIMDKLKNKFDVKTCYIAHTPTVEFENIYDNIVSQSFINNIDIIGFRSRYIKELFLNKFDYIGPTFQCYSGIPEKYIPKTFVQRDFSKISSFIFVGTLIKRKYPAQILLALSKVYNKDPFEMSYIGKGSESDAINKYSNNLGLDDNVKMYNYLPRDKVIDYLKHTDVFVMISKNEAFGLVYLEAMAQGCITIASKNEGFDGIIEHGKNGFLCTAGNVEELVNIIMDIRAMDKSTLMRISQNAVETAKKLTDKKAAMYYINALESLYK